MMGLASARVAYVAARRPDARLATLDEALARELRDQVVLVAQL